MYAASIGNIVFTRPIMEALTLYFNASIEFTTLVRLFLHFKRVSGDFTQLNNHHRLDKRLRYRKLTCLIAKTG